MLWYNCIHPDWRLGFCSYTFVKGAAFRNREKRDFFTDWIASSRPWLWSIWVGIHCKRRPTTPKRMSCRSGTRPERIFAMPSRPVSKLCVPKAVASFRLILVRTPNVPGRVQRSPLGSSRIWRVPTRGNRNWNWSATPAIRNICSSGTEDSFKLEDRI